MIVNFTVTYTNEKTFSVELPEKYEQYFEYKNGKNNPPTDFNLDLTYKDFWDFANFVGEESKKIFGEECDYIGFNNDWEMNW